MKKQAKKISTLLCVLCLLSGLLSIRVSGANSALKIHVEGCRAEDGKLLIYANDNADRTSNTITADNYEITLGSTALPCTGIASFSGSAEAASYIFLVDVSGSISADRLQSMKDYLKKVASHLRAQDRVSVVRLGNTLNVGGFVSGKAAVEQQIDAITGLTEDTNLYYGIVESLGILENEAAGKKALLILSDGHDDQTTGITRSEANDAVKEKRIPVYTVAMMNASPSQEDQDFAKILGSFARMSPGGIHTALGVENITAEESVSRMMDSVEDSLILTADLSGYEAGSGRTYLQVSLKIGSLSASDGYDISEYSVMSSIDQAQAEKEAGMETSNETSGSLDEEDSGEADDSKDENDPGKADDSKNENGSNEADDSNDENDSSEADDSNDENDSGEANDPKDENDSSEADDSKDENISSEDKESGEEEGTDLISDVMKSEYTLPVLIGAGVLLLLLLVLLLKKKSRNTPKYAGDTEPLPDDMEDSSVTIPSPEIPSDDPSPGNTSLEPEDPTVDIPADLPSDENITPGQDDQHSQNGQDSQNDRKKDKDSSGDSVKHPVFPIRLADLSSGRVYSIKLQDEIILGRSSEGTNLILSDDMQISQRHCAIKYQNGKVILRDLNSTNGTRVNGIPITYPYTLASDDIIQIGQTQLKIIWK